MAISFVRTSTVQKGETDLAYALTGKLRNGPVLWLLSGGSNIPVEVRIMSHIEDSLSSNLLLLLCDERYGPEGHSDSNYRQLLSGGFSPKQAYFPKILVSNDSIDATLDRYKELYQQLSSQADTIIGQFGIGNDGHIAGVLPDSAGVSSDNPIVYYEGPDYQRLSLSLSALKTIDSAYVFSFGENKREALNRLKNPSGETLSTLPSLILNHIKEAIVYNDQL